MNKNIKTILAATALVLATGCATAGTWVNGCYIDGPLCTVCDGTKVVTHTYGTTLCTHCDGTGIEPPEEVAVVNTVVMDTVVCNTWCPPPPPPPRHLHKLRGHHPPHGRPAVRPAPARPVRHARPTPPRPAKPRPAARPAGGPRHIQQRRAK